MAGVRKVIYKDKEILCLDYRGQNEAQMIETVEHALKIMLSENKATLQLSNITGATASRAFMNAANQAGAKSQHLTEKAAIIGIDGVKKVLLKAYNLLTGGKIKIFNTEKEALDYLTSD